ncbi:aminodeoxychorismate synthase component I [Sphingomonas jeddahensis]|uniref:Probable branched-chain-amino-acid aminotransferase n=1 Tax=Sphingomonas jeddahensis TaxID=1915074 RepID=A0A1V2EVF8_9SPHN|nr:aminodeoxychorismate synthase component I [Sphingomonas jeddahensis]ONF96144.1 Aminodeoxychorismate synthase component 1 [Sphingomonas jeddahensis]
MRGVAARGGRGHGPHMPLAAPFVLLDDARTSGAPARLYCDPTAVIEATAIAEVEPALAHIRAAVARGRHAAGFLSYEAGAAFEPRAGAATASPTPLLWFGLFDRYEELADPRTLLPSPAGAWIGAPQPHVTRDQYDAMLGEVLELIAAGDIYQANLTFRARAPFAGDPLALYAAVRGRAQAGWGAVVATGRDTLLSFSPELFFRLDDGSLTCRPMKGTARRDPDPTRDAAIAEALATDEKQRAENLMIVDLMRNDLSRVAAPGSVRVPELFAVEPYPTVHQMTSTVAATLAPGQDAMDVLSALFPCGSITGAPKLRAMQVIAATEQDARGAYTGAIGRSEANGDAQFNVAIRTLHIRDGDQHATLGLGGGIVADSRADCEWDEALAKGAFLTHGQRDPDLIETMHFDPEAGILLIERHLARMKASATTFGFVFDRHEARNELQAATFRLRRPARVRLLASASGRITIEVGPLPPARATPMQVALVPLPVSPADFRLHHKTSNRAFYDDARRASGADEVLFLDPQGFITEGSFTNVFVERDGRLLTPPLVRGLLPGVLRAELIDNGRAIEADLTPDDLAEGLHVGNALRGIMPATLNTAA